MKQVCWIGTRKGLIKLHKDSSADWKISPPQFIGDPISQILPDNGDGTMYVALNLGHFGPKLHRSHDQGKTWQECASPSFPKRSEETDEGKSVELIWVLERRTEDELLAGTIPAGLFRSTDKGDSWELIESLTSMEACSEWFGGGYDEPGIHSIVVDPRDSDSITVAISCGGAWRSSDGGKTWQEKANGMRAEYVPAEQAFAHNIQDPHRVIACPADPDRMWCQHHNGVFRYDESDGKWIEMEDMKPSGFGFALAVHPSDRDTAWFVPAVKDECRLPVDNKLVVNKTRDGGKTFESLNKGLPAKNSYDLIYRHCLDVNRDGDILMMGSTSGNLWVSEDGGEQWRILCHYLADIYCVKFS